MKGLGRNQNEVRQKNKAKVLAKIGYNRDWTVLELSKATSISRQTLYTILNRLVVVKRLTRRGSRYRQEPLWNVPEPMISTLSRAIGDQVALPGQIVVKSLDGKWTKTVMGDSIVAVLTLKDGVGVSDSSKQN